jgi:hypothetical protein
VRDALAYAETTGRPVRIVSIDFQSAFDNIAHEYLYNILEEYGIPAHTRYLVRTIYSRATSMVQINGSHSSPVHIHSSIRQGCPMSSLLFALCIDPLLRILHKQLNGIRIGRKQKLVVTAYADDVTIFIHPN